MKDAPTPLSFGSPPFPCSSPRGTQAQFHEFWAALASELDVTLVEQIVARRSEMTQDEVSWDVSDGATVRRSVSLSLVMSGRSASASPKARLKRRHVCCCVKRSEAQRSAACDTIGWCGWQGRAHGWNSAERLVFFCLIRPRSVLYAREVVFSVFDCPPTPPLHWGRGDEKDGYRVHDISRSCAGRHGL